MITSLLNWVFQKDNKQVVEDWAKQFPDRCLVCSYQSYGYANGLTNNPMPPPHECLYANKKVNIYPNEKSKPTSSTKS